MQYNYSTKYIVNKIFLAIDDSGVLSKNENYTVFGGIVIFDLERFNNEYYDMVKTHKIRYKGHVELKHCNSSKSCKNRILSYLNHYETFGCIINNKKIYNTILKNSQSKGRYLDFAIKMMIKNAIKNLIKKGLIDPYSNLEINMYVDENSYNSNGYYNLKDSVYNELKMGMGNIKNNVQFKNIIFGSLKVNLQYVESHQCYPVQAADFIAGNLRYCAINKKKLHVNHLTRIP